jgi:hypothetical protein
MSQENFNNPENSSSDIGSEAISLIVSAISGQAQAQIAEQETERRKAELNHDLEIVREANNLEISKLALEASERAKVSDNKFNVTAFWLLLVGVLILLIFFGWLIYYLTEKGHFTDLLETGKYIATIIISGSGGYALGKNKSSKSKKVEED